MEPVRVKVYGLFRWTRRRYVVQTIIDFVSGVVAMILWLTIWPEIRHSWKAKPNLPAYMLGEIAFLDQVPKILLIAVTIKIIEMRIIFRKFSKKEAEQVADSNKTSSP